MLEYAEIVRVTRKPTESLDAYDYYLRGMSSFHKGGREDISEALRLFLKAVELDDSFSSAYGMAAWCYIRRKVNGWAEEVLSETSHAVQIAEQAVKCGKDDAIALTCGGFALVIFGDVERGTTLIDRAQALNPNLAMAWHQSGWTRGFIGQPDLAVEHLDRAMRLSPVDPQRPGTEAAIAAAHFTAGRFDVAASLATSAILEQPNNFIATVVAAAANAMAGNLDAARNAIGQALKLDPSFRKINDRVPYTQPETIALWEDALRKAGLPD
jgi:tetratricopeptide (TPR) repeat protein